MARGSQIVYGKISITSEGESIDALRKHLAAILKEQGYPGDHDIKHLDDQVKGLSDEEQDEEDEDGSPDDVEDEGDDVGLPVADEWLEKLRKRK